MMVDACRQAGLTALPAEAFLTTEALAPVVAKAGWQLAVIVDR